MNSRKQWSEWRHKNEIKNLSHHYRLIYHRVVLAFWEKPFFVCLIIYNISHPSTTQLSTHPLNIYTRSHPTTSSIYYTFKWSGNDWMTTFCFIIIASSLVIWLCPEAKLLMLTRAAVAAEKNRELLSKRPVAK